MAWSLDGTKLATVAKDQIIRVYEPRKSTSPISVSTSSCSDKCIHIMCLFFLVSCCLPNLLMSTDMHACIHMEWVNSFKYHYCVGGEWSRRNKGSKSGLGRQRPYCHLRFQQVRELKEAFCMCVYPLQLGEVLRPVNSYQTNKLTNCFIHCTFSIPM